MQHEETIQFELNVETIAILGKEPGPASGCPRTSTTENCTSTCSPPTCCP